MKLKKLLILFFYQREEVAKGTQNPSNTLLEKGPYSEFFWSVFPAFGLNTERHFLLSFENEEGRRGNV